MEQIEAQMKECAAAKMLGTDIEVAHGRKVRRVTKGRIVDWRYTGGVVVETKKLIETGNSQQWPAFEIRIKPADGGRLVWVGPFKDSNNPTDFE